MVGEVEESGVTVVEVDGARGCKRGVDAEVALEAEEVAEDEVVVALVDETEEELTLAGGSCLMKAGLLILN